MSGEGQQFAWKAIEGEITPKGKGYLLLQEKTAEGLSGALAEGWRFLRQQGAREILVSGEGLTAETAEQLGLQKKHELLWMMRPLRRIPPAEKGYSLKKMKKGEERAFLALYNECFFAVPNSATYTEEDGVRLGGKDFRAGFLVRGGEIMGIYELKLEKTPEICSVGIAEAKRGRGAGKALMLLCLRTLQEKGYQACRLLVSSANQCAQALYRKLGFTECGVQSVWYERKDGGKP